MDISRRQLDARIVTLATANGRVIATHQLRRAGIAAHLIDSRVGWLLNPVSKGVYAVGPVTPEVRLRAVLAAVPSSAASHRTAAALHGLALAPSAEATVTARGRTRRLVDGVTIRGTRWLPPDDVTVVDGLRITSLPRTLCDLASELPRSRIRHLVEHLVGDERLNPAELQACVLGYRRRGRPGSAAVGRLGFEALATEAVEGPILERRAAQVLRSHRVEGWVPQYRPPWYDRAPGVVDLAWPDLGVVVELDGRRWLTIAQAQAEDRRRDRSAAANGWVALRFGWQEVVHRPGLVVEECRAVLQARRSSTREAR